MPPGAAPAFHLGPFRTENRARRNGTGKTGRAKRDRRNGMGGTERTVFSPAVCATAPGRSATRSGHTFSPQIIVRTEYFAYTCIRTRSEIQQESHAEKHLRQTGRTRRRIARRRRTAGTAHRRRRAGAATPGSLRRRPREDRHRRTRASAHGRRAGAAPCDADTGCGGIRPPRPK